MPKKSGTSLIPVEVIERRILLIGLNLAKAEISAKHAGGGDDAYSEKMILQARSLKLVC